jgi:hypothetical protein
LGDVESFHDRRLDANDSALFTQHLQSCEVCKREKAALEGLAKSFREQPAPLDELLLRRLRTETLNLAQAKKAPTETPPLTARRSSRAERARAERSARTTRRWSVLVAALASLGVAGLLFGSWSKHDQSPGASRGDFSSAVASRSILTNGAAANGAAANGAAQHVVEVRPEPGTSWERIDSVERTELRLRSGALNIESHHPSGASGLVVRVPDGVVSDVGTVFRVRVVEGRTVEIALTEGAVSFARNGMPTLNLTAPVTWHSEEQAREERPGESESQAAPQAVANVVPQATASGVQHAAHASRPSARQTANREDEMYLRVLQLLRNGQTAAAKRAAREYLDAYPNAFRRSEIQRLLDDPP